MVKDKGSMVSETANPQSTTNIALFSGLQSQEKPGPIPRGKKHAQLREEPFEVRQSQAADSEEQSDEEKASSNGPEKGYGLRTERRPSEKARQIKADKFEQGERSKRSEDIVGEPNKMASITSSENVSTASESPTAAPGPGPKVVKLCNTTSTPASDSNSSGDVVETRRPNMDSYLAREHQGQPKLPAESLVAKKTAKEHQKGQSKQLKNNSATNTARKETKTDGYSENPISELGTPRDLKSERADASAFESSRRSATESHPTSETDGKQRSSSQVSRKRKRLPHKQEAPNTDSEKHDKEAESTDGSKPNKKQASAPRMPSIPPEKRAYHPETNQHLETRGDKGANTSEQ